MSRTCRPTPPRTAAGTSVSGSMVWRGRDARFPCPVTWRHRTAGWRDDPSVWLHDLHRGVTEWHERLRATITPEQRLAVLRAEDAWCARPEYPDGVGGADVHRTVLQDGVRTPGEFAQWLPTRRAEPPSPE